MMASQEGDLFAQMQAAGQELLLFDEFSKSVGDCYPARVPLESSYESSSSCMPKLEDNGGVPVVERLGLDPALLERADISVYGTVKRVPSPDLGPKMVCIGRVNTSTGWRLNVIETVSLERLRLMLADNVEPARPSTSMLISDEEVDRRKKERKKMQRLTQKQEQQSRRRQRDNKRFK